MAELLSPQKIKIPLESGEKRGLIEELAIVLARAAGVPELTGAIRDAVLEREAVLTTGIGGGVALPHGKTGKLEKLALAGGVTREPVDFEALDGRPVRLVMMLAGPESEAGLHVKVLSRISRLLRKERLRDRLVAAADAEEFLSVIREAESR